MIPEQNILTDTATVFDGIGRILGGLGALGGLIIWILAKRRERGAENGSGSQRNS